MRWAWLALAVAAAPLVACGSARRSAPLGTAPLVLSAEERHGQRVFMEHCNQCHPGGDAGLAPALNNKPVPAEAIRVQVRRGFGRMPAFGEELIDERALDALVSYMFALRAAGG